jgi:hypothetical protein
MIFALSTVVFVAQVASGAIIASHKDHNNSSPIHLITQSMSDFMYPTRSNTIHISNLISQSSALKNMTKTKQTIESVTLAPSSSSLGSNASPSDTASTGCWIQYGSSMRGPSPSFSVHAAPAPTSQPLIDIPWDDLLLIHWPGSRVSNTTIVPSSTSSPTGNLSVDFSSTISTLPIPTLTICPDQQAKQSSTAVVTVPITTMSAPIRLRAAIETLQGVRNNFRDGFEQGQAIPSIPTGNILSMLKPGLLGVDGLQDQKPQTSTVLITVTATATKPKPTTTSIKYLTISTKITPTTVQTVTLSSQTTELLHTLSFSSMPEPSKAPGHTTVLSADPRCPYPFPGIHCDEPKTTLVIRTEEAKPSTTPQPTTQPTTTGRDGQLESSGWCPYPGQKC